jgi:CheY-like chemotaxis protein
MPESPPPAQPDSFVRAPQPNAPRCVLVDDDPYFLKLTEILVTRARPDLEIFEFQDAISALDFLSHQNADLIITDIRMPVMNGLQFTTAVRAINATVPIIVISSEDLCPEAMAHGANVFLTKSVLTVQLGPAIAKLGVRLPSGESGATITAQSSSRDAR